MAMLEGVIAFDKSVASFPWTSREAVTDIFRAQLSGRPTDAPSDTPPRAADLSRAQLSGISADDGEAGRSAPGAENAAEAPVAANCGNGDSGRDDTGRGDASSGDKDNGDIGRGTADGGKINGSPNGVDSAAREVPETKAGGIGGGADGAKISGIVGDVEAAVEHWSAQMMGVLADLRSVRMGGTADKGGGGGGASKEKSKGDGGKDMRWKPCEQAVEYRTLHRPGPNGTAVHTTCIEGVVHAPADAALAMSCDAPFFKEWWPNITMPTYRCEESKYIKRLGENFHLSFMRFKVPWPLPPQEFALIFVTVYDAVSGMTVTVLRTLPEDPSSADFTNLGYSREDAPPPLPGYMRMGINGGYAVKDMGEGRAHMRCIFTLDLKFPPKLVNFIIQQCGGIVYQWFTEELTRIYNDPESVKGKAFRQALQDEPLYNHVRAVMEKYRAARAAEIKQLELDHQKKQQESAGGQENGQAGVEPNGADGERNGTDGEISGEERLFRELGAEVEAKVEHLVASASRSGTSRSSSSTMGGDHVEIVEGGQWVSLGTRQGKEDQAETHLVSERGEKGTGPGGGGGRGVALAPQVLHTPELPLSSGGVQTATVDIRSTVPNQKRIIYTQHRQNGRYGLRASWGHEPRNGHAAVDVDDRRLLYAVDTVNRAIAALRLLHATPGSAVAEPATTGPAPAAAAAAAVVVADGAAGAVGAAASAVAEWTGGEGATAAAATGAVESAAASAPAAGAATAGGASGPAEAAAGVEEAGHGSATTALEAAVGSGAKIGVKTVPGPNGRSLNQQQQQQQQQQVKGAWGKLRKASLVQGLFRPLSRQQKQNG